MSGPLSWLRSSTRNDGHASCTEHVAGHARSARSPEGASRFPYLRIDGLRWQLPDDPFSGPRGVRSLPRGMAVAPALGRDPSPGPPIPRTALLINPFYAKSPYGSFGKHVLTPSLSLTSIAATTPGDWNVRLWDENLLQGPPPADPMPQVVGITVHLTFAKRAYELAAWYRARGALVVLGGMHVNSCPAEAAPHADAISVGDGVQTWPAILRDAGRGALHARYEASFDRDYDLDPPPRRDLVPRDGFLTTTSVIASRGCRNRCAFCYMSTEGLRLPYRVRDPHDIARQVEADGQPYFVFVDNNLGARPDYLRRLCRAVAPLQKIWSAAVTLDVTDDPSLVREMALAGCNGVFIGFETLNDTNLSNARKRTPRAEDYGRRVRILHDHGIQVNGSFVVGFDGDGHDTFKTLAEWIEVHRLACATFHILTPYPGTPLFEQLEREGRLLHRNWELYDTSHVVFRPLHLTADELLCGYDWLYRRLFSPGSIWARRPEAWSEWSTYFAGAYLYKHSNWLWRFLIEHQLVRAAWRPLVETARRRQLALRGGLLGREPGHILSCGATSAARRAIPPGC
jgi:radical SAM superfamily enzyme YgiQ (UPF0313 family)